MAQFIQPGGKIFSTAKVRKIIKDLNENYTNRTMIITAQNNYQIFINRAEKCLGVTDYPFVPLIWIEHLSVYMDRASKIFISYPV